MAANQRSLLCVPWVFHDHALDAVFRLFLNGRCWCPVLPLIALAIQRRVEMGQLTCRELSRQGNNRMTGI
jgi:hypothetical protein